MKVSTLACIQGAWLPDCSPKRVLDIGAGTGLLSLMAAQKYNCKIDAVEIEEDAFFQLCENVSKSPWESRVECHNFDIKKFATDRKTRYDFIITNPPFFNRQFKSSDDRINLARHEKGLVLEDLVQICNNLLSEHGIASIILPPLETKKLMSHCRNKCLYISAQLVITDSPQKEPKGIISYISRAKTTPCTKKLFIKMANGEYTSDFVKLLKDYYLYL